VLEIEIIYIVIKCRDVLNVMAIFLRVILIRLQDSKLTTNWSHMRLDFRLCA